MAAAIGPDGAEDSLQAEGASDDVDPSDIDARASEMAPPSFPTLDAAIEAAEAEGSWLSFREAGGPTARSSTLETLLDLGPECTVGQLLDDDDFVHAFQNGNQRLRDYLCGPSAVCSLVEYVCKEPPEDLPENAQRRRPYVAAEVLVLAGCCDQLTDALVGEEPLSLLWDFLDADPCGPDSPSPALAGYFCSSAVALLSRRPAQVTEHLRSRGPERVFGRLMAWLETRSFALLLTALLCTDNVAHVVFPVEGLVGRLLGCLEGNGPARAAAQSHLAFVFDTLLSQCCSGEVCYADGFLEQFTAREVVDALMDHVVDGCSRGGGPAAQAATDILASGVAHLHRLRRDIDVLGCSSPTARSLEADEDKAPQRMAAFGQALVEAVCEHLPGLCGVLDAVAAAAPDAGGPSPTREAESRLVLKEAVVLLLHARSSFETAGDGEACGSYPPLGCEASVQGSPEEACARLQALATQCDELWEALQRRGWAPMGAPRGEMIDVTKLSAGHAPISELLSDLRSVAQQRRRLVSRPLPIAGIAALEIASLLTLLAKTAHASFREAALGVRLLPRCLAALLACAWSSPVQGALWTVLSEFLDDEERGLSAVLDLVSDAVLMRRVVAEVRPENDAGYIGYLRLLCSGLQRVAGTTPEVADALSQIRGWQDFVVPILEDVEKLQTEPLGGRPPDTSSSPSGGFDCLEAIRRALKEAGDDVDLSLEDVRDIVEEDTETEQVLEMFQIPRRRPPSLSNRQPGQDSAASAAAEPALA